MLSKEIITPVLIISRAGKSRTPLATPKNIMTCCSTTKDFLLKHRYDLLVSSLLLGLLTGTAYVVASVTNQRCQLRVDLLILGVLGLLIFRVFWGFCADIYPALAFVTRLQQKTIGWMSHIIPLVCLALLILMFRTRAGSICQQQFDLFSLFWFYLQTLLGLLISFLVGCIALVNIYFSRAARLNIRLENMRRREILKVGSMVLHLGKSRHAIELFTHAFHETFQVLTQVQIEAILPTLVSITQEHLSWKLDDAHIKKLVESESTCFSCGEAFSSGKWLTINPSGNRRFHHDCVLPLACTPEGCASFFEDVEASYTQLREILLKKTESAPAVSSLESRQDSSASSSSSGSSSGSSRSPMAKNLTAREDMDAPKTSSSRKKDNKVFPVSSSHGKHRSAEVLRTTYKQPDPEDSGLLDEFLSRTVPPPVAPPPPV